MGEKPGDLLGCFYECREWMCIAEGRDGGSYRDRLFTKELTAHYQLNR